MRVVDAEIVPDPRRWENALSRPFDTASIFRAIDGLRADVEVEDARLAREGKRVPAALAEAMGRVLDMDDWLAANRGSLTAADEQKFVAELRRRGQAVYRAMSRRSVVSSVGEVPEVRRMGDDSTLLGYVVLLGGLWLADKIIGKRGFHG